MEMTKKHAIGVAKQYLADAAAGLTEEVFDAISVLIDSTTKQLDQQEKQRKRTQMLTQLGRKYAAELEQV